MVPDTFSAPNVLRIERQVGGKQRFRSVKALLGNLQEVVTRLGLHPFTSKVMASSSGERQS